ncbi:MAG: hypothetical protein M1822_000504 [Bathelium mastoideum]|nr:MAG: hypothetical protein M1822_000504 [Bathelium mastoideum]
MSPSTVSTSTQHTSNTPAQNASNAPAQKPANIPTRNASNAPSDTEPLLYGSASGHSSTQYNTAPNTSRSHTRRREPFLRQQIAADYLRHALRSLGLNLVLSITNYLKTRKDRTEDPNIATFESSIAWALGALIHVIAIAVSTYVVGLNWKGKYNGQTMTLTDVDQSFVQLALQSSSKLAEMIIVASMAALLCAVIRHEVMSKRGTPLSGLSSCLDFRDLSYLWSKELWALAFSDQASLRLRLFWIPCLVICCILTSFIGPAIAILVQARSDVWAAGGSDIWLNATAPDLYPPLLTGTRLNNTCALIDSSTADSDCPSLGWQSIQTWFELLALSLGAIPNYPKAPGGLSLGFRDAIVLPAYEIRMTPDDPTWPSSHFLVPNAAMARALRIASDIWILAATEGAVAGAFDFVGGGPNRGVYRYFNWNQISMGLPRVWSPSIEVSCGVASYPEFSGGMDDDSICVKFWDNPNYQGERVTSCGNAQLVEWAHADFADNISPTLHWISGNMTLNGTHVDDWNMTTPYSGAAVVTLPGGPGNKSIAGCRVHADYELTQLWHESFTNGPVLILAGDGYFGNQPPGQLVPEPADKPPAPAMDTSWLEFLNPMTPGSNRTVFEQLSTSVGLFDQSTRQSRPQSRLFEIMLMVLIGNGVARSESHAAPQGAFTYDSDIYTNPGEWWREWLPTKGVFGRGGNGFMFNVSEDAIVKSQDGWLRVHLDVNLTGYGYSAFDSAATRFAAAAVLTYVGLTGTLLVLSLLRRGFWTSTAWKSPAEMIVLALRSRSPEGMFDNTSAGIDSLATLKKGVRIRPVRGRLQIVVVGGDYDDGSNVMPNVRYN